MNSVNEDVDRLIVTLGTGLGTLRILVAVCDDTEMRQEVIHRYEEELSAQEVLVYRLVLNLEEPSLLQVLIDGNIDKNTTAIATVMGAEKIQNIGDRKVLDGFLEYLR